MFKFIQTAQAMVLTGGLLMAGAASAADEASILFPRFGTIRDWQADSNDALFVQDVHKVWYRATFWSPCHELPFAFSIGFVTDHLDRIDKFSSIRVGGERCQFRTFEKSDAPPPKHKKGDDKAAKPVESGAKAPDGDAKPSE